MNKKEKLRLIRKVEKEITESEKREEQITKEFYKNMRELSLLI